MKKKSGKPKNCWSGYERTPGTKAGEKGSCRKKGTKGNGKTSKRKK